MSEEINDDRRRFLATAAATIAVGHFGLLRPTIGAGMSKGELDSLDTVGDELVSVTGTGLEAAADWSSLRSPESYLGSRRRENVGEGKLNHWTLSGDWAVGSEAITLHSTGGKIGYRFHARDLHLVMGPAAAGAPVRFRVRMEGELPGAAHGLDLDPQGTGQVTEPRLYQLIRQPQPIVDRGFEIEFLDPGVEAFVFTFG